MGIKGLLKNLIYKKLFLNNFGRENRNHDIKNILKGEKLDCNNLKSIWFDMSSNIHPAAEYLFNIDNRSELIKIYNEENNSNYDIDDIDFKDSKYSKFLYSALSDTIIEQNKQKLKSMIDTQKLDKNNIPVELYYVMDGSAPVAKLAEQKCRRMNQLSVSHIGDIFDRSNISFKSNFYNFFVKYMINYVKNDLKLDNIVFKQYFLHPTYGEGEHLIFKTIKTKISKNIYKDDDKIIVVSNDSDCFILTLFINIKSNINIYIHTEMNFEDFIPTKNTKGGTFKKIHEILLVNNKILMNYIKNDLNLDVHEFIILVLFAGNDFMKQIYPLNTLAFNDIINLIIKYYNEFRKKYSKFLVNPDTEEINIDVLIEFILFIGNPDIYFSEFSYKINSKLSISESYEKYMKLIIPRFQESVLIFLSGKTNEENIKNSYEQLIINTKEILDEIDENIQKNFKHPYYNIHYPRYNYYRFLSYHIYKFFDEYRQKNFRSKNFFSNEYWINYLINTEMYNYIKMFIWTYNYFKNNDTKELLLYNSNFKPPKFEDFYYANKNYKSNFNEMVCKIRKENLNHYNQEDQYEIFHSIEPGYFESIKIPYESIKILPKKYRDYSKILRKNRNVKMPFEYEILSDLTYMLNDHKVKKIQYA